MRGGDGGEYTDSDMEEDEDCEDVLHRIQVGKVAQDAREGTIRWYLERKDLPIYPGAPCTVIQSAWNWLDWKQRKQINDDHFAAALELNVKQFEAGHLFPACVTSFLTTQNGNHFQRK
jgi:hypothetical protein